MTYIYVPEYFPPIFIFVFAILFCQHINTREFTIYEILSHYILFSFLPRMLKC